LTNIYRFDHIPAIKSMRTTVSWRTPWILRPWAYAYIARR